jgi:hypothetical protein
MKRLPLHNARTGGVYLRVLCECAAVVPCFWNRARVAQTFVATQTQKQYSSNVLSDSTNMRLPVGICAKMVSSQGGSSLFAVAPCARSSDLTAAPTTVAFWRL